MLFNISFNKNRQTGFTLIELLVVIAIIGILSTFTVIIINSAKAKARDAKRAWETRQIITALNLYYQEYGFYPKATYKPFCPIVNGLPMECSAADPPNFLKPLQDAGYFPRTPIDPLNDIIQNYIYVYFTYSCQGNTRLPDSNTPTYYGLVWSYEILPETCNAIPTNFCSLPETWSPPRNTACSFNTP